MSASTYFNHLVQQLEVRQDEVAGQKMADYMKGHFPFYGVKAPERSIIIKQLNKELGKVAIEDLKEFFDKCWDHPQRELQMAAMEITQQQFKKLDASFIPFLEKFIIKKSWWDTVDWIAPRIGLLLLRHEKDYAAKARQWIEADNIWLQRSAILLQLKFKEHCNEDLLFELVERRSDSTEFFIRKGAGWALREYSKRQPQAVKHFVESHQLAPLTRREAMKYVK